MALLYALCQVWPYEMNVNVYSIQGLVTQDSTILLLLHALKNTA